ncbi:MAG: DUF1987 domain-containing protein [Brumimicrobium sp.]|nr:DUF1987 domain-containing protein [Brumimicrobium sp.]MCO5268100.1 DUF1987 domain-containing protein [Brumimicrobium sp.]
MENFKLEGTSKTPAVDFNAANGILELKGRSIPENSVEFYQQLNNWVTEYGNTPHATTVFNVKLEYFNTSSSKCLLDFFKLLEKLNEKGTSVEIKWFYEEDDEDMEEAGEDYNAIVSLPFTKVAVKEI